MRNRTVRVSVFVMVLFAIAATGRLFAEPGAPVAHYAIDAGWATFGLPLPPGAATAGVHKGEIELLDWSWGETNSGTHSASGGGGAGKVSMQDFHFVAKSSAGELDLTAADEPSEEMSSGGAGIQVPIKIKHNA